MKIARPLAVLWFVLAFAASRAGLWERFSSAALFGLGAAISASAFTILFWLSQTFRDYTRARGLKEATLIQVFRLYGTLALFKAHEGVLPPLFALPTGIGDIALRLSAFFVAARLVSSRGHAERGFYLWHVLGLMHLALAVGLALLTSTPQFGWVSGGVTSQPMTEFPMSLTPTFVGPFVLIAHLAALVAARSRTRK